MFEAVAHEPMASSGRSKVHLSKANSPTLLTSPLQMHSPTTAAKSMCSPHLPWQTSHWRAAGAARQLSPRQNAKASVWVPEPCN